MDMDQKLEEMRRKALYEKYSKMIEDQGEWDEIGELRKQAAREDSITKIETAQNRRKRLHTQDQIKDEIVERVKAGESEQMISEVLSVKYYPISKSGIHRLKLKLQEEGRI